MISAALPIQPTSFFILQHFFSTRISFKFLWRWHHLPPSNQNERYQLMIYKQPCFIAVVLNHTLDGHIMWLTFPSNKVTKRCWRQQGSTHHFVRAPVDAIFCGSGMVRFLKIELVRKFYNFQVLLRRNPIISKIFGSGDLNLVISRDVGDTLTLCH